MIKIKSTYVIEEIINPKNNELILFRKTRFDRPNSPNLGYYQKRTPQLDEIIRKWSSRDDKWTYHCDGKSFSRTRTSMICDGSIPDNMFIIVKDPIKLLPVKWNGKYLPSFKTFANNEPYHILTIRSDLQIIHGKDKILEELKKFKEYQAHLEYINKYNFN
ncbi:MAG: hypothetical protein KC550_00685 [Nanoarchaeota archaeon]|nr:hypothetical protein [Nanoarchaeota archaeon]